MKITKQISERKFEVELEDLDFSREKRIIVAHDYVRFMGNSGMQTISSSNVPLHTVNTCANWIPMMQEVTIPIREMVKLVLPFLNSHEYCNENHIKDNYVLESDPTVFYRNGVKMIALREEGKENFNEIPYSLYEKIKKGDL